MQGDVNVIYPMRKNAVIRLLRESRAGTAGNVPGTRRRARENHVGSVSTLKDGQARLSKAPETAVGTGVPGAHSNVAGAGFEPATRGL
jgi:hypothetical protein